MASIVSERVWSEINAKIVSTLSLPANVIVAKATKFIRFDWRELIEYFEQHGSAGLQPPYCIVRPGMYTVNDDYGMATVAFNVPVEIFYIQSERNTYAGTAQQESASNIHTLSNSIGLFVGQRLYFQLSNVYGTITVIGGGNQITFNETFSTILLEQVTSDVTSDVEVVLEILNAAFQSGLPFTNFQIMDDGAIDVSDYNPANEYHEENNYALFAGSLSLKLLVGRIP